VVIIHTMKSKPQLPQCCNANPEFPPQDMRANIVHDVEKVEGQLDAEAREDEEARRHYGEREWPLQPASVCTANLRDRVAGYKWAVPPASCLSFDTCPVCNGNANHGSRLLAEAAAA
jgi:ALIX V-shaped domain binding to HIV